MSRIPIISVVIPLLNKRDSIGRTIESILRQTVSDIEVLVVDGGSSDGSVEIVEAAGDPRIRVMRQPNTGISEARNNGVQAAASDVIAFIDGDDEWTPVHLENLLRARRRFPLCGVYATEYYCVLPDGTSMRPQFSGLECENGICLIRNYFAASKISSLLTCSSIAVSKEVFDRVGGFPVTEIIKHEFCFFVRIGLDYEIGFCREPTFIYHMEAENRFDTRIKAIRKDLKDCDTLLLRILDDAITRRDYRNPHVTVDDIRAFRRKALYWRASDLLRIGQRRKGWFAVLRCMATREYFARSVKLLAKSFLPQR